MTSFLNLKQLFYLKLLFIFNTVQLKKSKQSPLPVLYLNINFFLNT